MVNLNSSIKSISRITPKYAKILEKMGIFTVSDFLFYFPFRYDDFSKIVSPSDDFLDQAITVKGKIIKAKNARTWKRRMNITEILVQDKNNNLLKAIWFNQPYILENLNINSSVRLSGKLSADGSYYSMSNPAWERASCDATNTGRLVPVYSETTGLTSKWIRWQMKMLLSMAKNIFDILPNEIRKKYNLYDISTALSQIHFPDSQEKLIRAQKRFAFQEMFLVQLKALQIKKEWEGKNSIDIKFDEKLVRDFVKKLPFRLTDAQRKASFEILKDLEKPRPMNRLLNGDVGSGKTVVAAIAALQTISAGYQVAIMAPTEVLARQHFLTFSELLKNYDINVALLTNSYQEINNFEFRISNFETKSNFKNSNLKIDSKLKIQNSKLLIAKNKKTKREELLNNIVNGNINLIIGTHALIQKDIKFKNLALVVIDEQHRFGVAQRAALQNETMNMPDGNAKTIPHLLTMTATPIPRTLAIAFFGSLDLSVLDEMPKSRKAIITKVIAPGERLKIYEFIKSEIKKNRQVFVIFPLVEESKSAIMAEVKAATEEHKKLEKIFPEFKIGLLHGRLKSKDKEKIMQDFQNKKIDILVSTSVVEVGVDITNASIMIIENAERFGLTQLHQFRGRVGRGEHQSYCFLFVSGRDAINRVSTIEKTNDGFKIAEKDLELRGPGQFFGTIQSGLPDIAMENLSNIKLIKFARAEAQEILTQDPQLKKHSALQDALKKFEEKVHLE